MKTEIYKSYEDFLKRVDKKENGVSTDFAAKHPNFEEQNKTNTGCWNCYDCSWCENCYACDHCESCKSCDHSNHLNACSYCSWCEYCKSCTSCNYCSACKSCESCEYCKSCSACYGRNSLYGCYSYKNDIESVNEATVSVSFDSLIEKIKELGYSVLIRNSGDHKVITWSTKNHWASAPYKENSEEDLKLVCQRLKETITDVYYSNAH